MLTELWGQAAQTGLAPLETDRRCDPFVPVLFEYIAAMSGVRIGQRLVDRLDGARGQPGVQQPVAQRFAIVLAKHSFEFRAQFGAMGDTILVARKTGVGAEFGFADFLAE